MLEVEDLSVTYPNGVKALYDAGFSMKEGGICGIIGPNGSGKTTLIKGILGLVPARGTVLFRGKPIKEFSKKIAYVEQKGDFDRDFPINVFECVLSGTYPKLGFFRRPGEKEKAEAREALEKVGLSDLRRRQIGELSGGQFQRVLIARALVMDADLFFLDEPFVGIDETSEAIIIKLLKGLAAEGKTIFIVHHDLTKVKEYFDSVILINKTIIGYGPVDIVFNQENLKAAFGMLVGEF